MYKYILSFFILFSVIYLSRQQEVLVDTDYSKAFLAYQKLSQISHEYELFKDRIIRNTSIEYNKCAEAINTLKCNNIDQWHSVVSELKLINENSESAEIPFLIERKEQKIEKLKGLLTETEEQNKDLAELLTMLQKNQKELIQNANDINLMYKLPHELNQANFIQLTKNTQDSTEPETKEEETAEEPEIKEPETKDQETKEPETKDPEAKEPDAAKTPKQKPVNVPDQLNNDVPDVANKQLTKAKQEYDIADESIQAQAARNIFVQYSKKVSETIHHTNEAFELKFSELRINKEQLKEDIVRSRVLISNEKEIQQRNLNKITEMKGKIEACKGMPTNLEKDCEPLRVTASKLNTEIEIIQQRTSTLHAQLKYMVSNNMQQSTIKSLLPPGEQQPDDIQEIFSPPHQQFEPRKPQELQPLHHYSSEEEVVKPKEGPESKTPSQEEKAPEKETSETTQKDDTEGEQKQQKEKAKTTK